MREGRKPAGWLAGFRHFIKILIIRHSVWHEHIFAKLLTRLWPYPMKLIKHSERSNLSSEGTRQQPVHTLIASFLK